MSAITEKIFKQSEQRIAIPSSKQEQCFEYATKWIQKNPKAYSDTFQSNPETVLRQVFYGKVAELAARRYIKLTYGINVTEVDFNIYDNRDKSWQADLATEAGAVHVKSCCSQTLSGGFPSWIFQGGSTNQRTDNLLRDNNNDWTVFCEVSHYSVCPELYVDILAVLPWSEVSKKLRFPNSEALQNYKRVLYYSSLIRIEDEDGFVTI